MIRIFCDCCGEEIIKDNKQISVVLRGYDKSNSLDLDRISPSDTHIRLDLHTKCADKFKTDTLEWLGTKIKRYSR